MFAFDEGLGFFARASACLPLQDYVDNGLITVQQIDPAEMSPVSLLKWSEKPSRNVMRGYC